MLQDCKLSKKTVAAVFILAAVVVTLVLLAMGQPFHCSCDQWWWPWSGDVWSSHNSQHLLDPYSFTHVSHGLVLYWICFFALGKLSVAKRFALTLTAEAVWELIENSPWIIKHYRENTVSLDYFGDSALNSVGDLLCCGTGFLLAAATPWWGTLVVFVGFEVGLLLTIRDNLILNVLNLVGDFPGLVEWQKKG
ncbi:MAG: DUF2585 family protein [Candidatus Eremiobacteraeota bacterium]|nr:DUF2585 family protein [Candidatus Eremiobacteraeota bacterium]